MRTPRKKTSAVKILCLVILCMPAGCWDDDDDDDSGTPDGGAVAEEVFFIDSTDPSNGALGVERDAPIDIFFSEPIDPNTLTEGTIDLTTRGVSIPGSMTLNATGTILRIMPLFPLAPSTTYEVTVTEAVRDLEGNALPSDFIFSFTTVETESLDQ
ncbi:MAG TPA: Ig-like domain-containing protein [Deltaproteobacteria bacterium]|jgi:hypothetical protein|nr:Ig-like domain-containing protein [Deltaproteobacteria bacterium]HOI06246.1 Ig-like domain-containing protein [Deltaproteobacteria bacterium]